MIYIRVALLFISFLAAAPPITAAFDRRTPVVEAIEKAGPAVVNVRTEQIIKRRATPFFGFADPFFEEFFRDLAPPRIYKTQSLGSGVIVDRRGYILTNNHVIEKASRIYIALPGQTKEIEAKLTGRDERIDLAVLMIDDRQDYPYLAPGPADDLLVGETVIAIGNPLGLGHSVTTGVVSALHRRLSLAEGMLAVFIQTDALINPGNSGGPLININGELIGINTAIARQAQGIGFAIPVDTVNRVLADLIKYGHIRQAFTGIIPAMVGQAFRSDRGEGGVLVNGVEADSPAAAAGIRYGDVILALGGVPVASPAELLAILHTYTPADQVKVLFLRGLETRETALRLTTAPAGYGLGYAEKVFGFALIDARSGVEVSKVRPGSAAAAAGIRPGDLVAEVEGKRLSNTDDLAATIENLLGQEPLRFLIVRGNRGYYVELP